MSAKRSIAIVAMIFVAAITTSAGAQITPPEQLRLDTDVALFKGIGDTGKVEIYQSIGRSGLEYKKIENYFVARYLLQTQIVVGDSANTIAAIEEADTIRSMSALKPGQQFVYTQSVYLPAGAYTMVSVLTDQISERQVRESLPVHVRHFPEDSLTLSDIQLAMQIGRSGESRGMFDKNNLHILPNPQGIFGDNVEAFHLYTEAYNLGDDAGNYRVNYYVESATGDELYKLPGRSRAKKRSDAAIYTSFDLSNLASGRYQIRVEVTDEASGRQTSMHKPFAVYRTAEAYALIAKEERQIYANLDEAALDLYFQQIVYIADAQEKKLFRGLNTEGKREFLVQFWMRRDPTPGTPQNEFKDNYILRLLQTKVHFSVAEGDGWKSDRGRVLLTYGAPDFMDKEHSDPTGNPFEVWHYEKLEGGVKFFFVDRSKRGEFRLVHSTHRGEIQDPSWQSVLSR